jgi:hypothetical protein
VQRTAISSEDLRAKVQAYRQEATTLQNVDLRQHMLELAMNLEHLAAMTESYEAALAGR